MAGIPSAAWHIYTAGHCRSDKAVVLPGLFVVTAEEDLGLSKVNLVTVSIDMLGVVETAVSDEGKYVKVAIWC
jgi:hypothetical protein